MPNILKKNAPKKSTKIPEKDQKSLIGYLPIKTLNELSKKPKLSTGNTPLFP